MISSGFARTPSRHDATRSDHVTGVIAPVPMRALIVSFASTYTVITLDSGTSTFASGSGMFTSIASGRRNTVVTMKKISKRNAMSTMGVMSMRTPPRRRRRTPVPFLDADSAAASMPAIESSAPGGGSLLPLEIRHQVEARRFRFGERRHEVGDGAELGVLVALHHHDRTGVAAAPRYDGGQRAARSDLLRVRAQLARDEHAPFAVHGEDDRVVLGHMD